MLPLHDRRPDLKQVLRRRRGLRRGVVTLLFIIAGATLGVAIPRIEAGPTVSGADVTVLASGLAAGMITFIGLVFSLLFMVVQFASTTWTPRLNFFRENPVVWRSFGYFIGVFIWAVTTALVVGLDEDVTILSPATGVVLVLGALAFFRSLQTAAVDSLQLAPILHSIVERDREVIDVLYVQPHGTSAAGHQSSLDDVRSELRWPGPTGVLRRIDLPRLVAMAESVDGVIELTVQVGDNVREGRTVALIRGGAGDIEPASLRNTLEVGLERTMEQDPRFGFRLLADIALRALSPAVNDQATAIQAIDSIDSLLTPIAERELDIGRICDASGRVRVLVAVPSWAEYVELAIGDVARAGSGNVAVMTRLAQLTDDVLTAAPLDRRAPLVAWRQRLCPAGEWT